MKSTVLELPKDKDICYIAVIGYEKTIVTATFIKENQTFFVSPSGLFVPAHAVIYWNLIK